jgi:dimeric dUTPase (all-alpha-NTP-PPase superfamily)
MNYSKFNIIYETNKELDELFDNAFTDPEMYKKNQLELIVEIGELANETRFFKYWSNKPIDMDKVKEEYADCFMMTLYFFNKKNISLEEEFTNVDEEDKVEIFARLYKLAIDFYYNDDKDTIKEILATLVELGYIIGFNDQDIIDASLNKINRNKKLF